MLFSLSFYLKKIGRFQFHLPKIPIRSNFLTETYIEADDHIIFLLEKMSPDTKIKNFTSL